MKNVAKRVMSLCLAVLVMISMFVIGGVTASAEGESQANLLYGLSPTSFFKRSDLMFKVWKNGEVVVDSANPTNPEQIIGTLLTDGTVGSIYENGVRLAFSTSNPGERSYYVYDMQTASVFNKLEIYAGHVGAGAFSLRINPDVTTLYYSDDGQTWKTATVISATDETTSGYPGQKVTMEFAPIVARYVKIEIGRGKDDSPGLAGGYALSEISLSLDKTEISNKLFGVKAEDFYPLNSQVGSSYTNTKSSMGTLLTDGIKSINYGEYKWYVPSIPTDQSPYVTYSLYNREKLNNIILYSGSYNSTHGHFELIVPETVDILYDEGNGVWKSVQNISVKEERSSATPPQIISLNFDTINASKIKVSIGEGTGNPDVNTPKAFRIMEIEAYYTEPEMEFYDGENNLIEGYVPGDTVTGKIKLGDIDNLLCIMAVKEKSGELREADIAEYIGNGYWKASVTVPENSEDAYIECFVWEKDTMFPVRRRTVFYNNALLSFVGRWEQNNSAQYTSNFAGAYVETNFTGNTAKVNVGDKGSKFYVTVDGTDRYYSNGRGVIDVSDMINLQTDVHNIRLASRYYTDELEFKGFEFGNSATISKPAKKTLIEFVGDSITAGFKSSDIYSDNNLVQETYGYLCAEELLCDHTHIARSGITLTPGQTNYQARGMSELYYYTKWMDQSSKKWDMATYIPDIIVINLGTNDANKKVMVNGVPTEEKFKATYKEFITDLRRLYPQTEIFLMECFNGAFSAGTEAAVNEMNDSGDTKVHFVDTTDWIDSNTGYVDGVHPNAAGHASAANKLKDVLAGYIR